MLKKAPTKPKRPILEAKNGKVDFFALKICSFYFDYAILTANTYFHFGTLIMNIQQDNFISMCLYSKQGGEKYED